MRGILRLSLKLFISNIEIFITSCLPSDISALFTHARMKSSPVQLPTITTRPSPRNGAIEWYVRAVRRGFRWRRWRPSTWRSAEPANSPRNAQGQRHKVSIPSSGYMMQCNNIKQAFSINIFQLLRNRRTIRIPTKRISTNLVKTSLLKMSTLSTSAVLAHPNQVSVTTGPHPGYTDNFTQIIIQNNIINLTEFC